MERTGSIGVGSFVLRKKTHLAGSRRWATRWCWS
jgi:hypothetical protein